MSETAERTSAHQLATALDGLLPVIAADAITADLSPRDRAEVKIVLAADWDYLPEPVADIVYRHGFAPATIGHRAPDHRYVVAIER